ncbi:hypothetical protein GCM10027275_11820 [Rhabdobacter roseus]|uniref:DUF3307 domain-containing protein n=1 Tax=Rhabdobacter roseus TaxID=1655419 RepID=A0A840TJI8_9BACT|nr:DUF3307 domain-containing protein [Rhabdobacter roseus]MBB5283095.1 hypothetical protein [Rhabdobacter roseus]
MTTFFEPLQGVLLVKLLVAHLLTDFFLQPSRWVEDKQVRKVRSVKLIYHVLLTGLGAGLASGSVGLAVFVALTHYAIDLGKVYSRRQGLGVFLLDQLLLLVGWLYVTDGFENLAKLGTWANANLKLWAVLGTYLLGTYPLGILIGMATKSWREQLKKPRPSLSEAGKWIGMLERTLILTFLLGNHFEAIGLLIAAKALLRFKDDDLLLTEYVLIGTLLSFTATILLGLGLRALLLA